MLVAHDARIAPLLDDLNARRKRRPPSHRGTGDAHGGRTFCSSACETFGLKAAGWLSGLD